MVAQLGTIAAVGAAFNGEYFVGLGDTQQEAFEAYLKKVSGVADAVVFDDDFVELNRAARVDIIKAVFEENEIMVVQPTSIQVPLAFNQGEIIFFTENEREDVEELLLAFIDDFVKPRSERIFVWDDDNYVNVGTIIVKDDIPEMHYVTMR